MQIFHQSVFEKWPLEDSSIQVITTSPPYWGLRKYDIPDITIGEWKGQYGLEETYQLYIEHTLLWAKEAWRVLKGDGVFFLNLGDSYNSHTSYAKTCGGIIKKQIERNPEALAKIPNRQSQSTVTDKCKLLIPHRVAVALIDEGWTLRNDLIWYKTNGMPESVTDRFSKKFEYVFMLTKQAKYYFDLGAVRERHAETSVTRAQRGVSENNKWVNGAQGQSPHGLSQPGLNVKHGGEGKILNPLGKNPGDVWSIPTQSSRSLSGEAHYAMWPEKLVERLIMCSTRHGDIVLDPFAGSGTTIRVAERLNRCGVGIDLGYTELQERRMTNLQKELL